MKAGESERFKFGNPDLEAHYCCYYCGLSHRQVEAGGMWFCPNIACEGPGPSYFRSKLSSYKIVPGEDKYTIDTEEYVKAIKAEIINKFLEPVNNNDHILEAIRESMKRLEIKIASSKFGLD